MSFSDLPEWGRYLIQGIGLCLQLVFTAIIVGRTGRTPYWALLSIIPFFYALVIGLWALAYCRWPKRD